MYMTGVTQCGHAGHSMLWIYWASFLCGFSAAPAGVTACVGDRPPCDCQDKAADGSSTTQQAGTALVAESVALAVGLTNAASHSTAFTL